MIFLRYESFRSYLRFYPVTSALLALNILVYILDLLSGHVLLTKGMFISYRGYNHYGFDEPWRYVTSLFLHLNLEHILFNMFSILVFAPPLERMLGHGRYAVFYLLSGVIGNLFSALALSETQGAGASGAIYGIFGAYLYLALMKKTLDEASRKTVYAILGFGIIYSFVVPRIGIWAHIGGLFGGFALAYIYDWYLLARRGR
ncbi:rhomboid family intramembrane serine protease [Paenibacillus humicola]|uniref:rhomboid family intramembrane serine protease n=1 Tax=Paenibacillus humicola TaxID=3110540 RepID=UPI00237B4282|nr:rhomboid family intramembrane serine protease [Paenibacillus humicola]